MWEPAISGMGNAHNCASKLQAYPPIFSLILFIFAKRIYDSRNIKPAGDTTKKPPKSQRLSSSKKIDNDRKFKISLGSVSKFAKDNEVTEAKRFELNVCYTIYSMGSNYSTCSK